MIAILIRKLALTFAVAFLVLAVLEQFNPAPPPMLVDFHRAGFPVCATVHNGPLQPHTSNVNIYPRRSDTA